MNDLHEITTCRGKPVCAHRRNKNHKLDYGVGLMSFSGKTRIIRWLIPPLEFDRIEYGVEVESISRRIFDILFDMDLWLKGDDDDPDVREAARIATRAWLFSTSCRGRNSEIKLYELFFLDMKKVKSK